MEFKQFQKINYSLDGYKLDLPKSITNKKWYATEKLHGSNFSIYFDGEHFQFAKRNSFLDLDKDYYNFSSIKQNLVERTKKLFNIIKNSSLVSRLDKIIIYGELLGGEYPGYNSDKIRAIQPGSNVFYCPNLEFFVFDLFLDGDQERFLTCDEFYEIVPETFNTVPILKVDKLNKLVDLDIKIDSKLPNILGLEKLKTNIMEGIVLRECSNKEITYKNQKIRPIIKIKNPEHCEIKTNLDNNKLCSSKKFVDILITKSRLESVVSKKDFNNKDDLVKKFIMDAWEDYCLVRHKYKITDPDNVLKELDAQSRVFLKDYEVKIE